MTACMALMGICSPRSAHADVQLAEDDEVERPDAAALFGDSPSGRAMDLRLPRPHFGKSGRKACSFRFPICVHADGQIAPAVVLSAVNAAESAWEAYTGPMGLPAPDASLTTGAFDLYLTPNGTLDVEAYFDERDARSRVDRGNAFVVLDGRVSTGCPMDAAVAYGVARGIQLTVAPATDSGSARAEAQSLASLVVPCAMGRAAGAVGLVQWHPELSFADTLVSADAPLRASFSRGGSLFYGWLDEAYGQYPGAIVSALWSLTPTITETGAALWNNEPDGFDVLRKSFKDALSHGSDVADLYLDFAVARAFQGSRSDGKHGRDMQALGDGGAVLFDWEVDFPDHARSLSSRRPLAPLGSAYFVVRTANAPPMARLRVEASWEERARMKLAVVKLDKDGRELGRLPVGSLKKATNAQLSIVDLTGVDRLMIVAVNAGDPTYQFDPDDAEWEPHALVVAIAPE
jgi:hypothetical protein